MVRRGEVWWYEDEAVPRRPVLILTRPAIADRLRQVLGVPATTVIRGIPSEVTLDRSDGMPRECVVNLDGTTQIRAALCTDLLTTLSDERMAHVCAALAVSTGCPTSGPPVQT